MKKLFSVLLFLCLLLSVSAMAEEVDAYTTASTTKTVLSGDALAEAEATGNYDTPAAVAAYDEYYKRHVNGIDKPYPDFLQEGNDLTGECYMVMQGPSEFVCPGKMRDWDVRERVKGIKVPCMALSGTDDEGTPYTIKEGVDLIPGCEWVLVPNATHLAHLQAPDICFKAGEEFIERHE